MKTLAGAPLDLRTPHLDRLYRDCARVFEERRPVDMDLWALLCVMARERGEVAIEDEQQTRSAYGVPA